MYRRRPLYRRNVRSCTEPSRLQRRLGSYSSDGLAAAKSKHYDFILLDLMLPEKKGNEVIGELRGEKSNTRHKGSNIDQFR